MHELLLFGQVPAARHEQVLKVLAGLSAMQPERVIERHAVYKPTQSPNQQRPVEVGGSQTIQVQRANRDKPAQNLELFYTQLVQSLQEQDFGRNLDFSVEHSIDGDVTLNRQRPWTLLFQDVPLPGKRAVLVRQMSKTRLMESDPHKFMLSQGNSFVSEYVTEGHQFVAGNIVLNLYRALHFAASEEIQSSPRNTLPAFDSLNLLDESGAYLLEASLLLGQELKPEIETKGTNELRDFQARIKGMVNLKLPERLSLDTRMK